ncbi:hypothetical protein I352_06344 [Cryptococcus deuterogattii MMRL2647]|nr:hypothetical protein I352_06344 [Cryptococcus deuterogattii MMRL2647]
MLPYSLINATGSIVISAVTLISALYLFIMLYRQEKGKLRVRLLVGMVISDLLLGLVILPPVAMYIANRKLATGSAGCNAQAFILIAILFTQHLWTLVMAVSTFLLLRHPLSRATTLLERYSWVIAPLIWGLSVLHAGLWYHYVGFVNAGSLCYYGTRSAKDGLDREICQFIPRAVVFIVVIVLYSRLFTFLRRPDTIQLPSHPASKTSSFIDTRSSQTGLRPIAKFHKLSLTSSQGAKREVDPEAPWEAMEFIKVGNMDLLAHDTTTTFIDNCTATPATPPSASLFRALESGFSSTKTLSPITSPSKTDDPSSTVQPPYDGGTPISSSPNIRSLGVETSRAPTTVAYASCKMDPLLAPEGREEEVGEDGRELKEQGQTIQEFFAEYQMTPAEAKAVGKHVSQQRSAANYFNRQASLLMLYFPIAYMAVFSVSLIRLIYDMSHDTTSPVLYIMSNWTVLSVGIIDGLVYGIAEFMVRRKVRKKMPEHL